MKQRERDRTRPAGWAVPTSMGVGAAWGLVVGLFLDQLAVGLAIGGGLGVVVGAVVSSVDDLPDARRRRVLVTAAAILATGLVSAFWLLRSG